MSSPLHKAKLHLLPASNSHGEQVFIPTVPSEKISSFTFGRGTVIWRIWPAVLLHTVFAAGVWVLNRYTPVKTGIPNVLLTTCGVVIGFVLSYRASSGYDRYWMGRSSWADLIRNGRTLGRLVWFHVPARVTVGDGAPPAADVHQLMREKKMILRLITAFAIATKHHLRGEMGIFYEDVYHLITPLHEHAHHGPPPTPPATHSSAAAKPAKKRLGLDFLRGSPEHITVEMPSPTANGEYGTFAPPALHRTDTAGSEHQALLPASLPEDARRALPLVATELIPFSSLAEVFSPSAAAPESGVRRKRGGGGLGLGEPAKHRPRIAGGTPAENLPLRVLWVISDWLAVCERRGTVPGTSLGTMIAVLASFEDWLSTLEKILTTPLPFVYSVHIRHTVWLYIFCLPFQLVDQFQQWTIPGVAIATFFFIGLLAAGEEIEQPFGYDENDLDLDLFANEIVHDELALLARTPGLNSPPSSAAGAMTPGGSALEADMHQGSVVEACLPKAPRAPSAAHTPARAHTPAPEHAPGVAGVVPPAQAGPAQGVLVDVHVPPAPAPGAGAALGAAHSDP